MARPKGFELLTPQIRSLVLRRTYERSGETFVVFVEAK
jgi:hypothetical protein